MHGLNFHISLFSLLAGIWRFPNGRIRAVKLQFYDCMLNVVINVLFMLCYMVKLFAAKLRIFIRKYNMEHYSIENTFLSANIFDKYYLSNFGYKHLKTYLCIEI